MRIVAQSRQAGLEVVTGHAEGSFSRGTTRAGERGRCRDGREGPSRAMYREWLGVAGGGDTSGGEVGGGKVEPSWPDSEDASKLGRTISAGDRVTAGGGCHPSLPRVSPSSSLCLCGRVNAKCTGSKS